MIGEIHHCSHLELAERLRADGVTVGAVVVDAPYSERTHAGHDGGSALANEKAASIVRANGRVESKIRRRDLDYGSWHADDVRRFVEAWSPLTAGWLVSLTDDALFGAWRSAMDAADRQTFQDVPATIRGMSVRLVGDGPSSWAVHIAVGRPRTRKMARWGTLDGAYVGPSEPQPVVGGKPLWLMRALVRDYSRPGDLVCDPCCGGGTTLLAAKLEGRRYIGCDIDAAHVEIARERLRDLPSAARKGTLALFGEVGR